MKGKWKAGLLLPGSLLILSLIFAGCADNPGDNPGGGGNDVEEYADGTYTVASEANEKGYVEAEVVIGDGEIEEVTLDEYRDTGELKGSDYGLDEWHDAMEKLPQRFEEANSPNVDVVSGATSTSEKAIDAVDKALQRAAGEEEPFDGTFMGVSDEDDRGYRGIALVTLENGEIEDVALEEAGEEGEFKDEDYDHEEWAEAAAELPERFREANTPEVDEYTGATSSSEKWMEAVERALDNASDY